MADTDDLIATVWKQLGGRGTVVDVEAHVWSTLNQGVRDELARRGLRSRINGFLRRQGDDGLPAAPEIDEHHTHAQLELLDIGEYKFVVRRYLLSSAAHRRQAQRMADRCFEDHGYLIDLDDPATWAA